MSETATEPTTEAPPAEGQQPEKPAEDQTDWKAEARKWEQRAKENRQAAAELEKQRQASMTEAEKAVAEAEARGRKAAATDYGTRLARAEFDAVAGRRNPGFDTKSALEWVDLTRFLGDDGELDSKAIAAAVERLVPAAESGPPAFDGGTRSPAPATTGMNDLIRKAAGRA